jgi:hypothetical protein
MNSKSLIKAVRPTTTKNIALRCDKCEGALVRQICDVTFCLEEGCAESRVILLACANGHVQVTDRQRKPHAWRWQSRQPQRSS